MAFSYTHSTNHVKVVMLYRQRGGVPLGSRGRSLGLAAHAQLPTERPHAGYVMEIGNVKIK